MAVIRFSKEAVDFLGVLIRAGKIITRRVSEGSSDNQ